MAKYLNCFFVFLVFLLLPKHSFSSRSIAPGYMETQEIFQSTTLTTEEKFQQLKGFFDKYPERVAHLMIELDRDTARGVILKYFYEPEIAKMRKLLLGRILLQNLDTKEIIPEFKEFLVKEIAENIEEFMRPQENYAPSGLAEYVYIASEFSGYHDPKLFDAFKDERTIPNLIKALNAPDWVWPKDQGDNVRGIPGMSTGRNVARQLIPIALAKLNVKSAIPVLKNKFQKHHDMYLQMNCAYALGYLLGKEDKKDVEKQVSREKNQNIVFEYAKGSIAVGDYSALKYVYLDKTLSRSNVGLVLYQIEQQLGLLAGIRDPGTKAFYSELVAFEPFRQLVAADYAKISVDEREWQGLFKGKDDFLNQQMHRIVKIYDELVCGVELNEFTDLWGDVKALGDNSLNPDIQNIAKAFCARSACR